MRNKQKSIAAISTVGLATSMLSMALLVILLMSGCSDSPFIINSEHESYESIQNESDESSNIESDENPNEEFTSKDTTESDNNANIQTDFPIIDNDIISVKPMELNTDTINSGQKRNSEVIIEPLFPTAFSGNKIFVIDEYYFRSDNSRYDNFFNDRNIIKSFDINTNEVENVLSYNFDTSYVPDFVYENHYFTFPCTQEGDKLQINITVSDIDTKEQTIIYKQFVTSPWYYADYLNSNEVVFLIFPREGEITFQEVIKYNIKTKDVSIIYRNEYEPNNENIWTFDTFEEHIFLLNTIVADSERRWTVNELDNNGQIISKVELDGLRDYNAVDCSVNQFIVSEKQFLIQFYNSADNSIFASVSREAPSEDVMQFERLVPCMIVSPFLIDNRYLIYNTCPDYSDYEKLVFSADLCIYDTLENRFSFFKADYNESYHIQKILSNELGDVLFVYADSELRNYSFGIVKNIISYL